MVFCIAGQAVRALREEALERLAQRMPDFGIRSVQTTTEQTKDGNYFPLNSSDQSGDASRDQSGDASKLNYGFGQKFDLKFRLTSDGKVVNPDNNKKENIKFDFSGDDDVWVFIDGQLVLDIGGDHGVVTGKIDFVEKKATVSKVKNASSNESQSNVEKF